MKTLHFSIIIKAPRQKVWDCMLQDATYRKWTAAFHEGSYFQGDWSEGSKMRFLGPSGEGKKDGGMLSRIKANRPHEYISIEHMGIIENGVEDTTSEQVKKWAPSYENYTFRDVDGGTEVLVDMDSDEEYAGMFEEMWPKALQKLKEVCETS